MRDRFSILTLASLFILSATSAAQAAPVPEIVNELVAEAKSQVRTIDMGAFRKVLEARAYDFIIDVREPDEFASGHVPDAINIPRGLIEFRIWALVGYPESTDTGMRLYLYCKTGGRCALAARSLQALGFTRVTAVDMKLADWEAAGYPLSIPEPVF